jgi:hypothetical protein
MAGCKPEVEIAPSMSVIFCRILFHLAFLLDLRNMAYLALSTRRSRGLWGKLAKLSCCKPEVVIAPSISDMFGGILVHLEVLLGHGNMVWFGVVNLTKFSIVALGKLVKLLVANRKWK